MTNAVEESKSFGEELNQTLDRVESETKGLESESSITISRYVQPEVEEFLRELDFDFEEVGREGEEVTLLVKP